MLLHLGFLEIRIWDVLDVLIVGYLGFRAYKLLRGSIAVNIFIGILLLLSAVWVVNAMNMTLLSTILNGFTSLGVVALVVIFQPELRRFLLFLGNSTLGGRFRTFLNILLNREDEFEGEAVKSEIETAIIELSAEKTGALIIISDAPESLPITSSGILLKADISNALLQSIFNKESPLHDGGVIISKGKIYSASAVMPVSDNPQIPQWAGLRHRAGIGISEISEAHVFIISEESGSVSYAHRGELESEIDSDRLRSVLSLIYDKSESID